MIVMFILPTINIIIYLHKILYTVHCLSMQVLTVTLPRGTLITRQPVH